MEKKASWHGVGRESIPWFPVVSEALDSCDCIKRQVFEIAGEVERLSVLDLRKSVEGLGCDIIEFSLSIPSIIEHTKVAPGILRMTPIGKDIEEASKAVSDEIVAKGLVIVKK